MKSLAAIFCGCLILLPALPAAASPYSRSDGIWVMNRDGSSQTKVTDLNGSFDVSPVGDLLVVAGQDGYYGPGDLHTVSLDSSQVTNLTNSTASEEQPAWSPNGDQIAFIRYPENPHTNSSPEQDASLWVINADGSGLSQIAQISEADIQEPKWSPDGTRIAFLSRFEESTEIWAVDKDGTDLQSLVESDPWGSLSWSPDSSEISFLGPDRSLRIVDAHSEDDRTIVPGSEQVYLGRWAPQRDKLLFSKGQGLYTVAEDGSDVVQLTDQYVFYAEWSPAESEIAFADISSISVIDSDGGDVNVLTREGEEYEPMEVDPHWSADGSKVVFARSVWQGVPQTYEFNRTVSSRIADGAIVKGRVIARYEECRSQVPLNLQWKHQRGQDWKTLIRYRTQRAGDFSWPLPKPSGFYRVVSPRLERIVGFDTWICERSVGRQLQLRP